MYHIVAWWTTPLHWNLYTWHPQVVLQSLLPQHHPPVLPKPGYWVSYLLCWVFCECEGMYRYALSICYILWLIYHVVCVILRVFTLVVSYAIYRAISMLWLVGVLLLLQTRIVYFIFVLCNCHAVFVNEWYLVAGDKVDHTMPTCVATRV